jgi:signal transduction histidine kinase
VSARVRAFIFSFQTKLIVALVSVIVLAIFLAGFVVVVRTRDERRQQALDRVAAASPSIYQQTLITLLEAPDVQTAGVTLAERLNAMANTQDVRIFLVTSDGIILHDTSERLVGSQIRFPRATAADTERGFVAWQADSALGEDDLTLVSASGNFRARGRDVPIGIVLAVKSNTIADAWLGVLPGLALAALVAVPIASAAGMVLARQVAQPVQKLTRATEALARGDFDQRVEVDRDDEIGRLAQSFTLMAARVGQRDAQMRALLANVSHDLKTPMTSITGYAQALTDGTVDGGDAARIGGVIRDEAGHVNQLLADLLYLGEIDAGQVVTHGEDAALEPIVARCVRRVEPAAQAKRICIHMDVAPDLVLEAVDAEKIERALTNVIDNAAKFSPEGGEITIAARDGGGGTLCCDITNTGSSIPDEDLPRVFDRFFRGDRGRRSAGGSGLGLAIARELVELNGGRIEARNQADGGVTFSLWLPGHPGA